LWECNLFHWTHPLKVKTNHTINLQMKNYQTCINRFIGIFATYTFNGIIFNSISSCYIIFFFNTWFIVLEWCSHHLFFFCAFFTFYCHLDHNCHVYSHFEIKKSSHFFYLHLLHIKHYYNLILFFFKNKTFHYIIPS
jgi:hypothetical protein